MDQTKYFPVDNFDYKYFFPERMLVRNNLRLQISQIGRYSMTIPRDSRSIIEFMVRELNDINCEKSIEELVVTDAMGGVGGDTITFAKYFSHVNVVELNRHHFRIIQNNLGYYGFHNYTSYNTDYLNVMNDVKQDIVYIDPPWGGRAYWRSEKLDIVLEGDGAGKSVGNITSDLLRSEKAKLVVLKLPLNFDLSTFTHEDIRCTVRQIIDTKTNKLKILIVLCSLK